MSFYGRAAANAERLIKLRGQAVKLYRKNEESTFDPVKGTYTETEPDLEYNYSGVLLPFKSLAKADEHLTKEFIAGKLSKLIVSAEAHNIRPVPPDKIIVADETFKVERSLRLSPAGTDIIFTLVLTRV